MNALKQNFGVPQTNITIYHPADITWHSNLFRAWSDPFAPVPFGILIIQLSLSFKMSFVLNSLSTTKSSFIAMWMMSICLGRQMDTQLKRHQDRKQFWVKCISRKNFWFLLVFVGVFFIGSLWGAFWSISANPWEGGGRSSGGIRQQLFPFIPKYLAGPPAVSELGRYIPPPPPGKLPPRLEVVTQMLGGCQTNWYSLTGDNFPGGTSVLCFIFNNETMKHIRFAFIFYEVNEKIVCEGNHAGRRLC